MRAIDLYSGVGGWSCGLEMCGIQVVRSYEIDADAIRTNQLNSGHDCVQCNILELDLDDLPVDIDLVVGSPPCTQFSYSNRGGQGDLQKGLQHIKKFLEVVDHIKPRWWVMENVPRTIKIVKNCFDEGGVFQRFSHLEPQFFVAKAELFGAPQRRRRALIGNLDFNALRQWRNGSDNTLGGVIKAISGDKKIVADPVYGTRIARSAVSDLAFEECLDGEEERINRTLKTSHHIYNKMKFPDDESVPSRTLTATCTRVSRESIIVRNQSKANRFRRLSIRERASLQGFPINYEFCAKSYAGKIKQIGNAIPPTLSLSIGCLVTGQDTRVALRNLRDKGLDSVRFEDRPAQYEFERKRIYLPTRSYRFSIDDFNFGSGVRFELTNKGAKTPGEIWMCKFWFGTAQRILELRLNQDLVHFLEESLGTVDRSPALAFEDKLRNFDGAALQRIWSHRGPAELHPFQLSDILTEHALQMQSKIEASDVSKSDLAERILQKFGPDPNYSVDAGGKLAKSAGKLLAGFLICSKFNALVVPTSASFKNDGENKALSTR